MAGNLLVQELHDPGVARVIEEITSNQKGNTLFSLQVEGGIDWDNYNLLAKALLDRKVNLLAVTQDEKTHTLFEDIRPQEGDVLVYVAHQRIDNKALRGKG